MKKILKRVLVIIMILALIFSVAPFLFSTEAPSADTSRPFPESRFMVVDNVKYHYRQWRPEGDSVKGNILFIHGFSGSTFSWRNNVGFFLKEGYNVVAVDMPAFGYSDRSKDVDYSTSSNASRLWKLTDSIQNGKWILTGHSMGGSMIGAMASLRPSAVQALVFADGPYYGVKKTGFGARIGGFFISSCIIKRWAELIGRRRFYKFEKFRELLSSAYGEKADSAAVIGYMEPFVKVKGTASAILEMSSARERMPLSADSLKAPKLIIWGKNDKWIPVAQAGEMKKRYPDAELFLIEGAGHCAMETQPEKFNQEMLRFLRSAVKY